MIGKRYKKLIDGVGVSVPKSEIFRFACCDCGLVHDMVLVAGRKEIGMAVRRNNRATAQRRRRNGWTPLEPWVRRHY